MSGAEVAFDLLVRVTDCCDTLQVPYFLGFYTTRIALTHEMLPADMRTSDILVPAEYVDQLCARLETSDDLVTESLKTNPLYPDTCVRIAYKNSTLLDLINPHYTNAPAYDLLIIPIVSAPAKKDKQAFMEAHYDVVQYNMKARRFRYGYMRLFPKKPQKYQGTVVNTHVQLLRYKFRKYRIANVFFSDREKIVFNGHAFSCVRYPEAFLSVYYKKHLDTYKVSSELNVSRYVNLPDIPYVLPDYGPPMMIRIYSRIIKYFNKCINKKTKYIDKQRQFFFRTVDRFAMTDQLFSQKQLCMDMLHNEEWEPLGMLLASYIEIMQKYKRQKMPFAFDYELYDSLIAYLNKTGTLPELLLWMIDERANAFSYLDYVNSYDSETCYVSE